MKDEKFRAWHWNKKRLYQVVQIDALRQEIVCQELGKEDGEPLVFPLDSCRLQRFTGFRDMNGEEIYEDDIVDDTCGRIGIPQSTHLVCWDEKDVAFQLRDYRGAIIPLKPHLLRVLGNKYKDRDIIDKS
ncbi:MAG: hypothetical protein JW932_04380 [Deltaproteobacteria bacterium]|nr:hypothetical protein [Deltaproteobacteria bacterium]